MLRYAWVAIALTAAVGAAPVRPASGAEAPSGTQRLVDIGEGRRINVRCMGEGDPAVIMTSGLGDHLGAWTNVQPKVAEVARTCSWDRAGLGASDPSTEPQDAAHTTGDLEKLLRAMNIPGPYVLVGHSIGSFETLLFAYRHPENVAAIVLVDPSTPFQNRIFTDAVPAFGAMVSKSMVDQQTSMAKCIAALESGAKPEEDCAKAPVQPGHANRLNTLRAVLSMAQNFDLSSAQVDQAKRPLGDIPLIVLTAGKRPQLPGDLAPQTSRVSAAWNRMHDDLAALSARGVNRQIPGAAHYIQRDDPDAVIAAVKEAVAAARAMPRAAH